MPHTLTFALLSCALLGLRHGFDYDHLAAITDITSVQHSWREGMRLGLLYALGHAFTIAMLGMVVIGFRMALPTRMDAVGERIVGATLIVLSAYVLWAWRKARRSTENGEAHHPPSRSRVALLISGARYAAWRVAKLRTPELEQPKPFHFRYDRSSVFTVGILHGLGAETPSQLLLFLLAANLGGVSRGFLGMACFILGLIAMNTLMTASASGLFAATVHSPRVQAAITSLTVAYSFAMGTVFFFGLSDRLPQLVR